MRRLLTFAAALVAVGCLAVGCSSSKPAAKGPAPTAAPAPSSPATGGPATKPVGTGPAGAGGIAAAPVQVAQTALGPVGYRQVGSGPPLVLINGFSASMDNWAPYFVDALATHFRVVVFDNAGIGKTAALASPLTITEMADQTSALITKLGLGRPDVLGWSMGGLVAQALAVTHPGQVDHLVLAATQAGTGKAVPVPAAAQAALESGNVAKVLSVLFPASASSAARQYVAGILRYPNYYTSSPAVQKAQTAAVAQWFLGQVPSGRQPGKIAAPTLVADGTVDAINPVSNDHMLAQLIPGSRLVLYPGTGHGFLFQDSGAFVSQIESFSSGGSGARP